MRTGSQIGALLAEHNGTVEVAYLSCAHPDGCDQEVRLGRSAGLSDDELTAFAATKGWSVGPTRCPSHRITGGWAVFGATGIVATDLGETDARLRAGDLFRAGDHAAVADRRCSDHPAFPTTMCPVCEPAAAADRLSGGPQWHTRPASQA